MPPQYHTIQQFRLLAMKKGEEEVEHIGNERKQQQQKKPNWQWTINKYKKTKKLLATTTNVEKCVHCSAKKRREGDELL